MLSRLKENIMLLSVSGLALAVLLLFTYNQGASAWRTLYKAQQEAWEQSLRDQAELWNKEVKRVQLEQQSVVDDLHRHIEELEARELPVKVVIKEVVKYVTPEADASCVIPAGFQWVYNESLKPTTASDMAASRPADVDAPTRITLSEVARVSALNNVECATRGEIIKLWRVWYLRNQEIFERLGLAP